MTFRSFLVYQMGSSLTTTSDSYGAPNKQLQPTLKSAARFGVPYVPFGHSGAAELQR